MKKGPVPASVVCAFLWVAGCGEPPAPEPEHEPLFPADYAASYTEVRNCRTGGEHDLNVIRVLADAAAVGPYVNRDEAFPVGAVVLKEEYDFSDTGCSEGVLRWTVMSRLEAGSSPGTLDWRWQTVDAERSVVDQDAARCHGCHTDCTPENGGYEGTCTVP